MRRAIYIVRAKAESAIEQIFISSVMMNFIRNHDPLAHVATRPMTNAVRNMAELREGTRRLNAATYIRERQEGDVSPGDSDRRRSRAFQQTGFRALQYSRGDIWRDPIRTSFELNDHITNELQQLENVSGADASRTVEPDGRRTRGAQLRVNRGPLEVFGGKSCRLR